MPLVLLARLNHLPAPVMWHLLFFKIIGWCVQKRDDPHDRRWLCVLEHMGSFCPRKGERVMYTINSLRQIITHAAVARGQQYFTQTFVLHPNFKPGSILGTRLTGRRFRAEPTEDGARVDGSFVLHIWYDYERGAKTENIDQEVHCHLMVPTECLDGERLRNNEFAEVHLLQEPHILQARIQVDRIEVTVEFELSVEVFGDCKLWVKTYRPEDAEEKDEDELWEIEDMNDLVSHGEDAVEEDDLFEEFFSSPEIGDRSEN